MGIVKMVQVVLNQIFGFVILDNFFVKDNVIIFVILVVIETIVITNYRVCIDVLDIIHHVFVLVINIIIIIIIVIVIITNVHILALENIFVDAFLVILHVWCFT